MSSALSAEDIARKRQEKKQLKAQKKLAGAQRTGTALIEGAGGKKVTTPPPSLSLLDREQQEHVMIFSAAPQQAMRTTGAGNNSDTDSDSSTTPTPTTTAHGSTDKEKTKKKILKNQGVLRELHPEEVTLEFSSPPIDLSGASSSLTSVVTPGKNSCSCSGGTTNSPAAPASCHRFSQLDLLDMLQIATATLIHSVKEERSSINHQQKEVEETEKEQQWQFPGELLPSTDERVRVDGQKYEVLQNPSLHQWLGVALKISEPFVKINVSPCCTLHEIHTGGRRVAYFFPSRRYFYDLGPAPCSSSSSSSTLILGDGPTATTVPRRTDVSGPISAEASPSSVSSSWQDHHHHQQQQGTSTSFSSSFPAPSSSPLVALTLPFSPNWEEEGRGKNVMIRQQNDLLIPVIPVKELLKEQLIGLISAAREELLTKRRESPPWLAAENNDEVQEVVKFGTPASSGSHGEQIGNAGNNNSLSSLLSPEELDELHASVYDDLCVLVKDYFHVLLVTAKNVGSDHDDCSEPTTNNNTAEWNRRRWMTSPLTKVRNPAVIGTRFNSTAQRDLKWNRKREPGLISALVVRRDTTSLLPPRAFDLVVEKLLLLLEKTKSNHKNTCGDGDGGGAAVPATTVSYSNNHLVKTQVVAHLQQRLGYFQPISIGRKDRLPFKLSYKFFSNSLRGTDDSLSSLESKKMLDSGGDNGDGAGSQEEEEEERVVNSGDHSSPPSCRPATHQDLAHLFFGATPSNEALLPPPPSLPSLAGAWVAEWSRNWTCLFPTLFIALKKNNKHHPSDDDKNSHDDDVDRGGTGGPVVATTPPAAAVSSGREQQQQQQSLLLADDLCYRPSEDHPEGDPRLGAVHPMSCQDSFYLFEDDPWKLRNTTTFTSTAQCLLEEEAPLTSAETSSFHYKWPHFQSAKLFAEWLAAPEHSATLFARGAFDGPCPTKVTVSVQDRHRSIDDEDKKSNEQPYCLLEELKESVSVSSTSSSVSVVNSPRVAIAAQIIRHLLFDVARLSSSSPSLLQVMLKDPDDDGRLCNDVELLRHCLSCYDRREEKW